MNLANRTRLWQIISPTLPVGAFHHSQGLEQAIDCGWVHDEKSTHAWIDGLLGHTVAHADLPVITRVHAAWRDRDVAQVIRWDETCLACRETRELRDEDLNMGAALKRLIIELREPHPEVELGFAATFAVLAANWSLASDDAMAGYAWSYCENQVAVAIKLVPLGYSAGQRVLRDLGSDLQDVIDKALACSEDEIGRSAAGLAIASSRHETQYTRLFRS
jgi:urease accessory protein